MANSERQPRHNGRRLRAITVGAVLSLLLAACSGGGGGGGGDDSFTLRVAFGNETDATATLAMEGAETYDIESCKGGVFNFSMPATDWIVTVNGETAIDSLQQDPADLDNDAVARLWLREDGTIELQNNAIEPGSNVTAPATLSICT